MVPRVSWEIMGYVRLQQNLTTKEQGRRRKKEGSFTGVGRTIVAKVTVTLLYPGLELSYKEHKLWFQR